jgi:hypothetical protein
MTLWVKSDRINLCILSSLSTGEFNRSTQHHHAEACRRGAGAIPLMSAKILDTALVPRALGRRLPPIWPLFQRSQSSAFSFSVTHVRACPSKCIPLHLPIRRHGCSVDRLNPPPESGRSPSVAGDFSAHRENQITPTTPSQRNASDTIVNCISAMTIRLPYCL